jgi:lysyl-tRNA synthetase class 2
MDKANKKAEEKARKDAEKAAEAPQVKAEKVEKAEKKADPSDAREYYKLRVDMVNSLREKNIEPFPHKFHVSISIAEFVKKYGHLNNGEILEDVTESVAG